MWEMVSLHELGPSQAVGIDNLNDRLETFKQDFGLTQMIGHIPAGRLINFKARRTWYPVLRAKAAETRHLLPFVVQLARDINSGSREHLHRVRMLEHVERFYDIIYTAGPHLTGAEHKDLVAAAWGHIRHYAWLGRHFRSRGILLYNFMIEHHYLLHMAEQAHILNPRFCQTYIDESVVGRIAKNVGSLANGPYESTATLSCSRKYVLGLRVVLRDSAFDC